MGIEVNKNKLASIKKTCQNNSENVADLIDNLIALNIEAELKKLINIKDEKLLELKTALKKKINNLILDS